MFASPFFRSSLSADGYDALTFFILVLGGPRCPSVRQPVFSRLSECAAVAGVAKESGPPKWIKPQLTRAADEVPAGDDWLHEIKYDGYRMHARLDRGRVQLLTRTGLDWSRRYPRTIEMLAPWSAG
jgi:ATP-dependent DNA ligase